MDWKEYEVLIDLINQRIETSEPTRAEYFRGYRRGIQFHILGRLEETIQDHNFFCTYSGCGSGDHYVDAYTRGYRDGCRGSKPEGSS